MKYIVVFDTNILLSALFSQKGSPFRCLALAKMGQFESVICREILDEFVEKLLIKFKFSEEKAQIAIEEVKGFSRLVSISGKLRAVPKDPDDDMVIECTIVGKAIHIVTGDKHLLSLSPYQDISIVRASEFLLLLSQM